MSYLLSGQLAGHCPVSWQVPCKDGGFEKSFKGRGKPFPNSSCSTCPRPLQRGQRTGQKRPQRCVHVASLTLPLQPLLRRSWTLTEAYTSRRSSVFQDTPKNVGKASSEQRFTIHHTHREATRLLLMAAVAARQGATDAQIPSSH